MSHLDTVIRATMVMFATDATSDATAVQRQWLVQRLQQRTRLSQYERERLQPVLVAYVEQHHPQLVPIVIRQFRQGGTHDTQARLLDT